MPICIGKITIIGPDIGLLPGRRQPIIWTNAGILLIEPLGTNFSEILIKIHTFSFKKIHSKKLSAKWWPICLGLNVLIWVRDLSVHAPSQWETTLHCNVVSHWLCTYTKWSLWVHYRNNPPDNLEYVIEHNVCLNIFLKRLNIFGPEQNGRHFADKIFTCISLNENFRILIPISLKVVPSAPLDSTSSLVLLMACCYKAV